jgi:molecular chaperone DnaK (HSP70)
VLDDLDLSPDPTPVFTRPITTPAHQTEEKLQQMGIEPVTVVADFLSHVRDITVESIARTYGPDWIRNAEIEWVLTVPAIWTDTATDLMVQAATKARFGRHRYDFNLVSEPEAAAAYTLKAIQPNDLNVGSFLVLRRKERF